MPLTENVWLALLAILGGSVVGPGALALIKRALPSRGETADAKAAEAEADATAAGAWQGLYIELKHRVDGLEIEVKGLRDSLREANDRVQIQALLLRSVCRWALLLRDELMKVGGNVPPTPPEVEEALVNLGT